MALNHVHSIISIILEDIMVYIRFSHNQVGMLIEASRNGKDWFVVELQKYVLFESPTYMLCKGVMSTDLQEKRYLNSLDDKRLSYRVVG